MVDPGIPDEYEAGYYVHDRLGSVRLVVRPIEESGGVVVRAFNSYTYTPYGQFYEGQCVENIANPFKFTGQWHDVEIDQYYLRARQYDPEINPANCLLTFGDFQSCRDPLSDFASAHSSQRPSIVIGVPE